MSTAAWLRSARRAALPLAGLLLGTLVSGCIPQAATRQGDEIAGLYLVFVLAAIVVFVIVWALLSWALWRYRAPARTATEGELPAQDHGNVALEVVWTALPALTIAVLFVLTVVTLGRVSAEDMGSSADASVAGSSEPIDLHVEAFQWGWRMTYPDQGVVIVGYGVPGPEAVLPVNRPIRVTLSAVDVIHSFYVPEFLVKYDAVPGRVRTFPLLIEREGVYGGQCAEFCGLLHASMPFTIRAVPPEAYSEWVETVAAT